MRLLDCPPDHSRIVYTPHPVTCEGQRNFAAPLVKGETLGSFLRREVPDWTGDAWEVRINGLQVPHEVMERVRPKDGTLIEVRGAAKKQALYIVAMTALTYFTFGLGAAAAGGAWGAGAAAAAFGGGLAGALFATAVFAAGSILINKVLGPKPAGSSQREPETVYNIGAGRNQARPYQPLPLVFGTVKYAPDILSAPYTWYEGRDQYLGMVLTPGVNAHRFEPLFNGDALLSSFQGVQVYQAGFPGMADQQIPLYSDADTIAGGELNKNQTWVQRTTSPRTVRVQVNLEYILGDQDSKGKPFTNRETVQVQYRVVGAPTWQALVSREFRSSTYDQQRATLSADVPEGQYDVRVRILGQAMDGGGSNGRAQFQWTTMTAVQADTATYAGIPRIGVRIKATGQLNGAPDELRCVVHSRPTPVWKGPGTGWVTEETSNPGAQILQYARGINDENGDRIAGIGLSDDMIDIAALQAFMLHCAANQFEYNYVIRDARSHDEMVNALAMAGFGQVTWAGGRLSVVWAAADQPLSGVVNMATIKKGEFQVDYTLANAADGIEYSYYDAEDWSTKTIRVPAPGVTTMLNPAQVTGEGVTSEAHAAMLARWHLAQSLYQYKDISFATDIEHLSYQRLSLLSLSHDLTQWGFSGRVMGASIDGGVVTLQLDEPVPQPPPGGAYVGLRIPGERTYRVFGVQAFTGETDTLTLTGAWPADAPLPGDTAGNPAHDTLWCYDFKATPGYRVRVVAIEPESDLKGARVAVVPEGPEFWNYVLTGEYIPAPNQSLLQTRPVASNLTVSEREVVQGDTVFTELVATFDVDGPVGDVIVQMSNENDELVEVARTTSRTAAWRIPGAGTYQVVVRPFSPDGQPGVAVATIYSTIGADAPPVLVDLFDVVERSGGVRLYTWGWLSGTTQSADFAGVEIRYVPGNVPSPDWAAMTPVGEDGYHTAPFEAVIPESGEYTFAARSRNTSGTLSTGMRVVTKTLGANLGEQIGGIGTSIDYITQQQVADQKRLDQEIADRLQADIAVAEAAGADATAKANAARDAAIAVANQARAEAAAAQAAADALAAEVAEIVNAPQWVASETYSAGWLVNDEGVLYRAKVQTTGNKPATSPTQWEKIGEYASLGEAVAAALSIANQTATDLSAESRRLDAVVARMPVGTDSLATQAMVAAETTARTTAVDAVAGRVSTVEGRMPTGTGQLATAASVTAAENASVTRDNALSTRVGAVEARMPTGTDKLANEARVVAAESASVTRDNALSTRVGVVEARMPGGNGALATQAGVASVETASIDRDNAIGQRIGVVEASYGQSAPNLLRNPTFKDGFAGWSSPPGSFVQDEVAFGPCGVIPATGGAAFDQDVTGGVFAQGRYWLSADIFRGNLVGNARLEIAAINSSGQQMYANTVVATDASYVGVFKRLSVRLDLGPGVATIRVRSIAEATNSHTSFRRLKLEASPNPTPYTDEQTLNATATSASVVSLQHATASADAALGLRIDTVAATANGAQSTATQALTASQENASAIISVRNQSTTDNLFRNAEWKDRTNTSPRNYYTIFNNGRSVAASYVQSYTGDAGIPTGRDGFIVVSNVSSPNAPTIIGDPRPVAEAGYMIEPGATYIWSYYASGGEIHNARMNFYDANGNIVAGGGDGDNFLSADGGQTLAQYARPFVVKTAPANARWAVVQFYSVAQNTGQTFSRYTAPMLERAKPGQTLPSPWSPGAAGLSSATFALQVAQDAQITLTTNVNGHVTGMVSKNDGQRSVISFLADVFEIITSGTVGVRFTRRNGGYFMRFYAASIQTIIGINFGQANNLCFWYGPNVGEENCNSANGTIWFNNVGSAYFGGSLSAGTLKNAVRSTQVLGTASVETGQFATNGNQKTITYSVDYLNDGEQGTLPWSDSSVRATTGTLTLQRSIGGGSWETLASVPVNGRGMYTRESGSYFVNVTANASATYTDNVAGTATRNYRAVLSAPVNWPFTIGSNPGQQTLNLMSVEQ